MLTILLKITIGLLLFIAEWTSYLKQSRTDVVQRPHDMPPDHAFREYY